MSYKKHARLENAFEKFEVNTETGMVVNRGSGKVKKTKIDQNGKHHIRYCIGNTQVSIGLADLLLRQEFGRFNPSGFYAHHLDGDPSNNRLENLFLQPNLKHPRTNNGQN